MDSVGEMVYILDQERKWGCLQTNHAISCQARDDDAVLSR